MQPLYTMPIPPEGHSPDFAYYQAFLREMSNLTGIPTGEKLLCAINSTAEKMQTSPAHIARMLVGYGLRAPRHAFPESFVAFLDNQPAPENAVLRAASDMALMELKDFWAALYPQTEKEKAAHLAVA